jgi:hypothetical protein
MTKKLWGVAALVLAGSLLDVAAAHAQSGPLSFFPLTPCRVVDTRNAPGPQGGPKLNANTERSFPILGTCAVPNTAAAVVFNVTTTASTDFGDIRIFPDGTPLPLASVVNFLGDNVAVANGAIIPVTAAGPNHVRVRVDMPALSAGQVHLVLDVTGYFQ